MAQQDTLCGSLSGQGMLPTASRIAMEASAVCHLPGWRSLAPALA